MKKNATLFAFSTLAFLLYFAPAKLAAQTDGLGLVFRVVIDGKFYDYNQGLCGYETATWGGTPADGLCGDIKWAYDITPDSLCCDSIPVGSVSGIVMIRRGVCEFGAKSLAAEKAGATAVIIANGTASNHGDDCNAIPMGAGAVGAQVTIPVLFVCRNIATQIDNALKAGKSVQTCFLLPRVSNPFATYHHATPVSQVTQLDVLGFNITNREAGPITDMKVKVDVTEPGGNVYSDEYTIPYISAGADTLVYFDGYTPAAVEGDFQVTFSNDRYTESRDSLHRTFVHTKYTFASDNLNLNLDGGADRNDLFITNLFYQIGSLVYSGDNGGQAKYITFGIANIDSVYVAGGDPIVNTLNMYVYKADAEGNGLLDLDGDFSSMEIVGIGTYVFNGTETEAGLVDAAIYDINTNDPGVQLEPNTLYYASIAYDGLENGSGRNCAFSNTSYVPYLFFSNEAGTSVASNPIHLGGSLSYWGDRTAVCRLQLDGYVPGSSSVKPNLLDATKYTVTPNPANDFLKVDLQLENQGLVNVSIFDLMGQRLQSKFVEDFQNGQINLDVKNIPSGAYLLSIRTSEGIAAKKVMICH